MSSTKATVNPYAVEVIGKKRKELVGGISHTEELLDLLIDHGVLSHDQRVHVSSTLSREDRNSKLLDILVSCGERACRIFFYPCLKFAEPDLYQVVRAYAGSVNEDIRDARRQLIGYLLERDNQRKLSNVQSSTPSSKAKTSLKVPSKHSQKMKAKKPQENSVEWQPVGHEDMPSHIFAAVTSGDTSVLEAYLADKDVNTIKQGASSLLHIAAEHGQLSVIELLLESGVALDSVDQQGQTALHIAAAGGHTDATMVLVSAGANLYAKDAASRTAVHLAAHNDHGETVQALVRAEGGEGGVARRPTTTFLHLAAASEQDEPEVVEAVLGMGADVNCRDGQRRTPLFHAVSRGNERAVEVLLWAGARVDPDILTCAVEQNNEALLRRLLRSTNGAVADEALNSALFRAVRGNQGGIVRALIDCGAIVNAPDSQGYTPLLLAAELGSREALKALIEKKASVEARLSNSTSALHLAVQSGSASMTKALLKAGLGPGLVGPRDCTPLHTAAMSNQVALTGLLLQAGAPVNATTQEGLTALHLACQRAHAEVAAQLLAARADHSLRDKEGRSALHWAALQGNTSTMELLLSAGADVGTVEKERKTALHLAAIEGQAEAVSALLKLGHARLEARDMDGCSPLHYAAANGHAEAVAALLSSGRNKSNAVDNRNTWRRTALHAAAEQGHEGVVELLLEAGAKINTIDSNKDTPLHCACRAGHLQVVLKLVNWAHTERANLQALNNVRKTPLQVAEAGETVDHINVVTLLKKKMLLIK